MIGFDAASAQDLDATFGVRIRVGRRAVPLTLIVRRGRYRIRRGAPAKPGATVTIGARDLVRLAVGAANWPELMSAGRLKLAGDPFLALRFPTLFKLPAH